MTLLNTMNSRPRCLWSDLVAGLDERNLRLSLRRGNV